MLILLDGPDLAGKTTLAENLAERLSRHGTARVRSDVTILHKGPPTAHPLTEYEEPLLDYRPGTGRHVICDRWHVGERVYPAVLGRSSEMTPAIWTHVEMFLRSRGALLVHVTAPTETLRRWYDERGDGMLDFAQIDEARSRFHDVVETTSLSFVSMSFARPWDEKVEREKLLLAYAEGNERACESLNPFVTYLGPPRPDLLLLGDRRGTPGTGPVEGHGLWPAFGTWNGACGAYLLDALGAFEMPDFGLANACDVDDPRELWSALGRPEVVALGTRAADRCAELGMKFRTAPHPQYVRRFHHARALEYRQHVLYGREATWSSS